MRILIGAIATKDRSGNSFLDCKYLRKAPPQIASATSFTVTFSTASLINLMCLKSTSIASNTRCGDTLVLKRVRGILVTLLRRPRARPDTVFAKPGKLFLATSKMRPGIFILLSCERQINSISVAIRSFGTGLFASFIL